MIFRQCGGVFVFGRLKRCSVASIFKNHLQFSTWSKESRIEYIRRYFHRSSQLLEVVQFNLADIGEGIREVVIKEWHVKVGDKVSQFDPICDVQSDKATVTISSRYDGVIDKLHLNLNEVCKVGQPLVDIEVNNVVKSSSSAKVESLNKPVASVNTFKAAGEAEQFENKPFVASKPFSSELDVKMQNITSQSTCSNLSSSRILATPSVRRIARENIINLHDVSGSGKDGRVLHEDIQRYLAGQSQSKSQLETGAQSEQGLTNKYDDKIIPLNIIQCVMRDKMTESQLIPHFVLSEEIDMSKLVEFRQSINEKLIKLNNIKITYLPFFIKAASFALNEFPILNSQLDEKHENIIYKQNHNIGIAMDTKNGLIVPTIKSVQNLSIVQIAEEINRLQQLGLEGKLSLTDLEGGTFTLSNIGSIGGMFTAPCIVPPQVAIGGIGRIQHNI
uniref:Dihydrolipoamide acetyltransferase component of pyruvate dehydrogenase complex n=1 Tax=Trichobilharzia regenti TaxID=157069 RepID=A0AA85JE66_TRIRE|nr:unnamed protein product [Trichobilharzia regenti]